MTALASDRRIAQKMGRPIQIGEFAPIPMAADTTLFQGAMVGLHTTNGVLHPAAANTSLRILGVTDGNYDNAGGSAGDVEARVLRGAWPMANSASADEIGVADIGADVFAVDDQTVAKTNGSSTRPVAGKCVGFEDGKVLVEFA
jgi:hypothetical protein